MAFFEWKEEYLVHIPEIDEQHQHLFEIVNNFLETITTLSKHENVIPVVDSTVHEIMDYTVYHFSTEEKYLRLYDYPNLAEHRAIHRKIMDEVLEIWNSVKAGSVSLDPVEVTSLAGRYLVNHIIEEDGKYLKYFHEQQEDFSELA